MINDSHLQVLEHLCVELSDGKINWAVTGSLGFALQGMPVAVGDIDIQTDAKGAYEIESRFRDYVVKNVRLCEAERIRSHFGALLIDGVTVEIMGDVQKRLPGETVWGAPTRLEAHKHIVDIGGFPIPVLTLEYEHSAYVALDRQDTAAAILEWMKQER
ncbi:nucleotidyltransferase domain-containing protein [Paenibacillus sp. MBLB4367]|uniref:nucleotidyltransferase domain-containing protein n=1 Tax=Paenibacillus sp. MBLB4367 TaxID=3384767 RepID=UPI003908248E